MAEIQDIKEAWEGHSGLEVETFLKDCFGTKYGYINLRFNEQSSTYYIECFANEEDYKLYESDKVIYEDLLLQNVQIPISTVEGDTYTALLSTSIPKDAKLIAAKDKIEIPLNFRGVKIGKLGNENAGVQGTLIIERSIDNGNTYTEVGRLVGILPSEEYEDKEKYTTIDLYPYLNDGLQMIRVKASYNYSDEDGNTRTVTSANVPIGASMTRTELRLDFKYNFEQAIHAYNSNGQEQGFPLNNFYIVHGAVDKNLHIEIKGSIGTQVLEYNISASEDNMSPSNVPSLMENLSYGLMTHGVKRVKAWMTCDDGLGNEVRSNELVNRVMVVNPKTPNAIMDKPYILLQNVKNEVSNYVQTVLCQYAVFSPRINEDGSVTDNGDPISVAFLLTDYTEDYENIAPTEYFRVEHEVESQKSYTLLTTVEIESDEGAEIPTKYDAYFRVRRVGNDGTTIDFMHGSTGEVSYDIEVDNTTSASPISGASFLMNPKVRNNTESNPRRILNARNNNTLVPSTWSGFGFVNDGWIMAEDGQKVLRIPAGASLKIELNPFRQFMTTPNSSMTMEIDFAVHNVTDEASPIINISENTPSGGFRGLRLNALEGWVMTSSYTVKNDCLFAWEEGKRTHISLNINHQVKPNKGDCKYASTDAAKADGVTPLARVLVDGDCYREIPFAIDVTDEWTTNADNQIELGNNGADVDIYSIRIYENKQIEMTDILNKNFVASQPTAEAKSATRERNDLLTSGRISLDKVKAHGINNMTWHGELPYHSSQGEQTGWYEINRYNENGEYMPEHSGTICKQTKSLSIKGQGSTAKTYYDWNQQDDQSKVKATIDVSLADFHDSISVRIDGDKAYIKGGNLGKNFPLETEEEVEYPYANGKVTVPDGWIDGNGKYRGMGYMVSPNTALAQKKVIKINYASSMQSHLYAACKAYDILHRAVVKATPLQKKVPTAVTAKHTEPFMLFQQSEGSNNIYFKGMGNYGAGKMDKVAWGYVKEKHPMFALIEGSDNNLPMTGFRVPFDKVTAVYSPDYEGWLYNGIQNWDFDGGATEDYAEQAKDGWQFVVGKENEAPTVAIRDRWADISNFIYLHAPHVKYYGGTFTSFKQSDKATDWNYKYYCTTGDEAFKLKRYCYLTEQWVDAGLLNETTMTYKVIDLRTEPMTKAVYDNAVQTGTSAQYALLTQAFNDAITEHGKKHMEFFCNAESLKFNYAFVLSLIAGTDNSDKNTYYEIMPYTTSVNEDNEFATWWKEHTGKTFDFSAVYQTYMNGDDMDSILRTDNNSHQTKPYYIDRMHPYSDDNPTRRLYEGYANALFNWCEAAYEKTGELASTMNTILQEMCKDTKTSDKFYGNIAEDAKVSVWGFMHKYFFNIQHYFPEIAYLEQARIRYEFPHLIGFVSSGSGARSIQPISQSLGSQLRNELQYVNRRLIYMASYAHFGALFGNTEYSIGLSEATSSLSWMPEALPNGNPADYKIKVRPHQYIYPTAATGQSPVNPHVRVSPKDEYEFTIVTGQGHSDTGISLMGINYYSSVGNFGDVSVQPDRQFEIRGKRLTQFVAEPTILYNGTSAFRPTNIIVDDATQIQSLSLKGCSEIGGALNLSTLTRCRSVNISGTQIYKVQLPPTEMLTSVTLPATLTELTIDGQTQLASVSITSVKDIKTLKIVNAPKFDSFAFIRDRFVESTNRLSSVDMEVNWTSCTTSVLNYLLSLPTCRLRGTIKMASGQNINFVMKQKLVAKFGNVDDKDNGLYIVYSVVNLEGCAILGPEGLEIMMDEDFEPTPDIDGNPYAKTYQFTLANPLPSNNANDIIGVEWSVEDDGTYAKINPTTGLLEIIRFPEKGEKLITGINAKVYTKKTPSGFDAERLSFRLYYRQAEVGDYVYNDGTFSAKQNPNKTVIGRCYYVEELEDGYVDRRMVQCVDPTFMRFFPSTSEVASGKVEDKIYYGEYSILSTYDTSRISSYTGYVHPDTLKSNGEWLVKTQTDALSNGVISTDNPTGLYTINEADATADQTTANDVDYNRKIKVLSGNNVGDRIPVGRYQMLRIILKRNRILNAPEFADVPNLRVPSASSDYSEWEDVHNLLNNVNSMYRELYFEGFSKAYAYEPSGKIANRFKAHNWYIGGTGEHIRILHENEKPTSKLYRFAPYVQCLGSATSTTADTGNIWGVFCACTETVVNTGYSSAHIGVAALMLCCSF